ncbi:RNA polymerase sigma factor [Foetidibacter luteolus]|uniref:RNA polymerase sigma factor n=1 Tax=Foetidibacter luteolus TaxID=2608880 RepID=UPI00129B2B5E|nr:sigma-70 family RNA polymerase sigma factor [Foetidibacter luteolus]
MHNGTLIPHLFRTEYRKIVAVLCKHFGFEQVETAEDIASETFVTAAQTWGLDAMPQNPVAWLYSVAKNKAVNHLRRSAHFKQNIAPALRQASGMYGEDDIDLSPGNISDSQLQMMFTVCHPCIPAEAQVGLSLRILCGFGIEEIAHAFLSNKETINKRLLRAKEKLREEKVRIEIPGPAEIEERLSPVLTTIYLLFNEGYYSVSQNQTLRKELCLEAIRLCTMLVENSATCKPRVNALLALMCFHISRFDARLNQQGELVLYEEQDADLWNKDWIAKGAHFLHNAASGSMLSKYHLEAGIAFWHTHKEDTPEKWENILQLYNLLLQTAYSPIAALNRTYALYKARNRMLAITEAEKLNLAANHFYFVLLGELYTGVDNLKAAAHFKQALLLAKTAADKQAIQKKLEALMAG